MPNRKSSLHHVSISTSTGSPSTSVSKSAGREPTIRDQLIFGNSISGQNINDLTLKHHRNTITQSADFV
jgi:hypothetical protein